MVLGRIQMPDKGTGEIAGCCDNVRCFFVCSRTPTFHRRPTKTVALPRTSPRIAHPVREANLRHLGLVMEARRALSQW